MRRFWFTKGTPRSVLLPVFRCRVQNVALSGSEAFIMIKADTSMIDAKILTYGRKIFRGRACKKVAQLDGSFKQLGLLALEIWKKMKLAPTELELVIRRL